MKSPLLLVLLFPALAHADWRINSVVHDGEAMARMGSLSMAVSAADAMYSDADGAGFQAIANASTSTPSSRAVASQWAGVFPWSISYFGTASATASSTIAVRPESEAEVSLDVNFTVLHDTEVPFNVWASPSIQRGHGDWSIAIMGPNYAFVADEPTEATLLLLPGDYRMFIAVEASALATDPETSFRRIDSRRFIGMTMLMIDEPPAWSLALLALAAWRMRCKRKS